MDGDRNDNRDRNSMECKKDRVCIGVWLLMKTMEVISTKWAIAAGV